MENITGCSDRTPVSVFYQQLFLYFYEVYFGAFSVFIGQDSKVTGYEWEGRDNHPGWKSISKYERISQLCHCDLLLSRCCKQVKRNRVFPLVKPWW